ncbi:MAG TPA: hypothetical protein VF992_04690 [Thermoplasmata archaeon]
MPDQEGRDVRSLRPASMLSGTALRSARAGLVAMFLVSLVFATFGPWFNLTLAYGLMVASIAVGGLGIWWADGAVHEAARNAQLTNGIYAKAGAVLSTVALAVSTYYTGLLVYVVYFSPLWLFGFLILYAFHRSVVDSRAAKEAHA